MKLNWKKRKIQNFNRKNRKVIEVKEKDEEKVGKCRESLKKRRDHKLVLSTNKR